MMIEGLLNQFKNYHDLRYGSGEVQKRSYTAQDSENFILDITAGMTIVAAAEKNNIPLGSSHRYVPDSLKKKRDRPLARKLAKDKVEGLVKMTCLEIGNMTNYSKCAIEAIVKKIKAGHVYED